jgi:hypothetical protein
MEKEILEQIIISIEAWEDPEKVGEEVRPLEDAIRLHTLNDVVMESLLDIIQTHKDDYELGRIISTLYIPIKVILNDDTINT